MKSQKTCTVVLLLLFILSLAAAAMGESYSLPMDNSKGPIPNPAGYISDTEYKDESLSVTLESRKVGDSMYHIAWVKISDPSQLRTALAGPYGSKKTAKTTDIAADNNAVVAINGDYFQYRSAGYEVRQGEVLRKTPNTKLDLLVVDEAGDFHIFQKSNKKELTSFLKEHTAVNAFTFGPALVKDGEVQTVYNSYGFAPQDRAPRVGIGQIGPLQYVLVVVDGRQEGYSRGITI
jgi:exopolysaccharide biosynthesis protein